jgi:hypothetical protein
LPLRAIIQSRSATTAVGTTRISAFTGAIALSTIMT